MKQIRSALTYVKESPYELLLFTAMALSLALVFLPLAHVDFRDTIMFRIPLATIVWIIPTILIFFWLLYLPTKRFLYSRTITWTHILVTVFTMILTVLILSIVFIPSPSTSSHQELIGHATRIVFILFIFGQGAYIVNVLLGLFIKGK